MRSKIAKLGMSAPDRLLSTLKTLTSIASRRAGTL
jgi:hypothetical protein